MINHRCHHCDGVGSSTQRAQHWLLEIIYIDRYNSITDTVLKAGHSGVGAVVVVRD